MRAGIIAATIANANRASKDSKIFQPSDFMPRDQEEEESKPKVQSVQEQKMILKHIFSWAKRKNLTKNDQSKPPAIGQTPRPGMKRSLRHATQGGAANRTVHGGGKKHG